MELELIRSYDPEGTNGEQAHGTGQKDARAAKRKYYLKEAERNERMTKGGDFVLSRRSEPLKLYDPHARNFVLCLTAH